MKSCVAAVLPIILLSSFAALCQERAPKPAFEVASIKPADPNPENSVWIGMDANAGMVRYTNITLLDCIRAAYRVREFQIQAPAWVHDARFEITAKLGAGTQDQIPEMLQSLLEERFKLEIRRETKEHPIYALVSGKGGPTLKLADAKAAGQLMTALGPDGKPRPAMNYQIVASGMILRAPAATLATVVDFLSRFTERPIVDLTGLSSRYDLTLQFVPEVFRGMPGTSATLPDGKQIFTEPGPTLFDAVQQYGLRLEPRKAPTEFLSVIHAERTPTEN